MEKFLIVFFLFTNFCYGQDTALTKCINTNAVFFSNDGLPVVVQKNISELPKGDFYMISQIHNSKIDIPLEQELLFALNNEGVYYDISEYPHSAFFLINEYLKTGDTALLKLVSEKAPFKFVKNVYQFNQTKAPEKQIKFFGIDYELFNTDRGKQYKNALLYIYNKQIEHIQKTDFYSLFETLKTIDEKDINALTSLHNLLQKSFYNHEGKIKEIFSNFSDDILLILSAPTKYKTVPKRDKWLFQRFKTVYDIILRTNNNPKFIASFGAAHVKASNNKNITHKLQTFDESPVKGKVIIIGTQYFNGGGGILEAKNYASAGIIDYMTTGTTLKSISTIFDDKIENVALLRQDKLHCFDNKVEKIEALSWLFLINKQEWVKHWKWE
jgi:hypothetical protein